MEFGAELECRKGNGMCADNILLSSSGEFDDHTSFLMMMNHCNEEWLEGNLNCRNEVMNFEDVTSDPHFSFFNDSSSESSLIMPSSFLSAYSFSSSSCSSEEDMSTYQLNSFVKRKQSVEQQHFQVQPRAPKKLCTGNDETIAASEEQSEEMQDAHCVERDNGRARVKKGSAADPQSVYARKRRERINERLKILQNLVPNGTKVDISTMLEQAIQYVKFMQLQIKLLSSDEHWMYTPVAFNGCLPDIPGIEPSQVSTK